MSTALAPLPGRRRRATATIASRLTMEGVSRVYGSHRAVDRVDLQVEPGQVVALLGHSGCGKTTLLRLAAGVEVPSEGRVLIDGREVASESAFVPPEQRHVGLMFQDYALFPHLSLLENVMFGLTALDRRGRREEALAALHRVGLGQLAGAYPHEASGGEQQRTALARAVVPRPGILLMDEPFSGLDSRLRDSVREDTLAVLKETGATAVIVTHDPEEAMRMSDRIVLMRAGRIIQTGTAEELYGRPESLFAARFFSSLNEFAGRVEDGMVATPLGRFDAQAVRHGEAAVVAIRPHGIQVRPAERGAGADGVPGRVVARRFLGEVSQLEVAVEGLDSYLTARGRFGDDLPIGADVAVSVEAQHVMVFPED